MEMNFTHTRDAKNCMNQFTVSLPDEGLFQMQERAFPLILEKIAEQIAEKFVKTHGTKIMKAMDPVAIANLSVAMAGNAVKDMLDKKLPDRVDTIVHK